MAYQYPLNGGRINASIGGNSTSAGAGYSLISTGTVLLAGGNNITLSQNGSAITISGANGLSTQSNQALSASNGSFAFQTAGFSNANGVTFGTSAGSIMTASVNTSYAASNHSHGNPTLNLTNISGTTASASNGLTLSLSAAAQTAQTQSNIQGIIAAGSTNRTGDISFANSNGVTFGLSNNTMTASVAAGGGGVAMANSQTTYTSGTANLAVAGGAMTIASTTGQSFNFSVPQTSSLAMTGIVSASSNGNTISIGAPAFSVGMSTGGNTLGTTGTVSNQMIFAGGNNITLSQATGAGGNTLSIAAGGGIALANSQTTYTSGTANLSVAGGAMTIASTTGQKFNFSVPGTSSFSATGALSMFTNGNTISIGAPAMFAGGISNTGNTSGISGMNTNALVLAGGNNITLSQSTGAGGNTISIIGGAGGGGAGLSAGTQSVNTGTVNFANSNGITFGMSGSNQITASHNGITSQTNQTIGLYALGNTTQNSSTTRDARSLSFNGIGAATIGYSNGSIQLSVPQGSSLSATGMVSISSNGGTISIGAPAYSAGMSNIGNTTGTSGTASNQMIFAGGNNITLSQATGAGGNTLSIIGGAGGGGGVALYDGVNSISSGTARLTVAGALTASINGQTLSLSVPTQSSISGTGIVSISRNGSTISIGAPAYSAGMSNIGNTTGTSGTVSNRLIFAGGNNITLSQATGAGGNTLSIIGGAGGGGIALANSQTTYTSGTANLAVAGGAMTIASTTGQSYNFSVPGTSSLVGTNGVSISTAGNSIYVDGGGFTASYFNPQDAYVQVTGQQGQGTLHMQPMQAPNVAYDRIALPLFFTASTASTATITMSNWVGIYTRNASTLSLLTSYSTSNSLIHSGTANSASNFGIKLLTISNGGDGLTAGQYWVGNISRTTSGGANAVSISQLVASQQNSNFSGLWGVANNATNQYTRGLGVYSATTSAMPSSVAFSDIRGTGSIVLRQPMFYFVSGTI